MKCCSLFVTISALILVLSSASQSNLKTSYSKMIDESKEQASEFANRIVITSNCQLNVDSVKLLTRTMCDVAYTQQSICYTNQIIKGLVLGLHSQSSALAKLDSLESFMKTSQALCYKRVLQD